MAGASASPAGGWIVTNVGTFRGDNPFGLALNDRGEVIWNDASGMAFVWRNGKRIKLGTNEAVAHAINDRGQIVGLSDRVPGGGFIWENGRYTALLGSLQRNSSGNALNERGQVVGVIEPTGRSGSKWFQHAFLWQKGRMRDLGAVRGRPTVANVINEQGR